MRRGASRVANCDRSNDSEAERDWPKLVAGLDQRQNSVAMYKVSGDNTRRYAGKWTEIGTTVTRMRMVDEK